MKKYALIHIPLIMAVLSLASCQSEGFRPDSSLNHGWNFCIADSLSPEDCESIVAGGTSVQSQTVDLPHTPRYEPMVVNNQWQGICYYWRTVELTSSDLERNNFLRFDGAMNLAEVYINGKLAAEHAGGYLPFLVDMRPYAKEGHNLVVVRLDNRDSELTGPKPLRLLDFCTYGGLYRGVSLVSKSDIYITDASTRGRRGGIYTKTEFDGDVSKLNVTVDVRSEKKSLTNVRCRFSLYDDQDQLVASTDVDSMIVSDNTLSTQILVKDAKRWSPSDPNLYKLEVTLMADGTIKDHEQLNIGFREIVVRPEGLYLNGKLTFLRGVNRHQEYPFVGYALSDAAQWRDAWKIKDGGFDYVRCSHYPPSVAFLDACDHLGIMVLDAILGWQYFGGEDFEMHSEGVAQDLIRRDRNHACILAWELSINETQMPDSFIETVNKIRDMENAGTLTAGWMKDRYDIYIEARQHRNGTDPTRPLIVSEYGDWEYYAQNGGFNQDGWGDLMPEARSSRQPRESDEARLLQQATNVQEAHNENRSTHALADGYWALCDYNRGYADDLEYSGAMDIFRQPKFSYEFFRSQRSIDDKPWGAPMVYIASQCEPASAKEIRVYSNCPQVRLFANETEVEGKPMERFSDHIDHAPTLFLIEGEMPDSLVAVGLDEGKEICRHTVRRALEPDHIQVRIDTARVAPVKGTCDPIFVHADIVDKRGTIVRSANDSITISVEGDALFATPDGLQTSFKAPALAGTASAVLIVGNGDGKFQLSAENR